MKITLALVILVMVSLASPLESQLPEPEATAVCISCICEGHCSDLLPDIELWWFSVDPYECWDQEDAGTEGFAWHPAGGGHQTPWCEWTTTVPDPGFDNCYNDCLEGLGCGGLLY